MKRRIKINNVIVILLLFFGFILITSGLLWLHYTGSVSSNNEMKTIVIENGVSSSQIGKILEENDLIENATFFKIYLKMNKIVNLKAGTYELAENMSLKKIIEILEKGNNYNENEIEITFKEGSSMRDIASVIEKNTNNSYDSVMNLLKDKEYLQELIDKYWFITDDILNDKLYYSLEGYLFPETYRFSSKDVSVKEIFNKLIDQMLIELIALGGKEAFDKTGFSAHEILTLSSIVEKEGKVLDFENIATVFHNRIKKNMKLESCATTFYGMGLDFNATGIANSEMIANNNPYNTYKVSKLPVGPISSPSKKAIEASLNPNNNKYLYFLSDSTGKSYFFNTYKEHQQKKAQLQREGKWDR